MRREQMNATFGMRFVLRVLFRPVLCFVWYQLINKYSFPSPQPADCKDNITFLDEQNRNIQDIESATLNKLVERITSPDEYGKGLFVLHCTVCHVVSTYCSYYRSARLIPLP